MGLIIHNYSTFTNISVSTYSIIVLINMKENVNDRIGENIPKIFSVGVKVVASTCNRKRLSNGKRFSDGVEINRLNRCSSEFFDKV